MAIALVDSVVLIDYKVTGAGDRHDRAEVIVEGIEYLYSFDDDFDTINDLTRLVLHQTRSSENRNPIQLHR